MERGLSGADLMATVSADLRMAPNPGSARGDGTFAPLRRQDVEIVTRHQVGFYSDDRRFLDDLTQFIGAALEAGNAAIRCRNRGTPRQPSSQVAGTWLGY